MSPLVFWVWKNINSDGALINSLPLSYKFSFQYLVHDHELDALNISLCGRSKTVEEYET